MALKKRILSLSLVLGLTASSLVGCSSKKTDVVATMRNAQISKTSLEKELNFSRAVIEASTGEKINNADLNELANNTLNYLTTTEMLCEEGVSKKLDATQDDINSELKAISDFLDQNDTIKQAVKNSGFTEQDVKDAVKRTITANNFYLDLYKNISISEADVEEFYNENKTNLYSQEYADASHILIKTIDDNGKPLSAEKKAEAKKKAEEVLKKVESGEDFSKLAKEYSEDTSAKDGGELGKFTKGQMVSEFEDAAFALKPGKTSKIVETQYGYHIIKLNDKGTEIQNYNDIASKVRQDLMNDLLSSKLVELENKHHVKINNEVLSEVVKESKSIKLDDATNKTNSSEDKSNSSNDKNSNDKSSENAAKETTTTNDTKKN